MKKTLLLLFIILFTGCGVPTEETDSQGGSYYAPPPGPERTPMLSPCYRTFSSVFGTVSGETERIGVEFTDLIGTEIELFRIMFGKPELSLNQATFNSLVFNVPSGYTGNSIYVLLNGEAASVTIIDNAAHILYLCFELSGSRPADGNINYRTLDVRLDVENFDNKFEWYYCPGGIVPPTSNEVYWTDTFAI